MTATPPICCYQTPADLPGERSARLTTPDGKQVAWAARPDDRRGASLIFDGLTATGMDWKVNPPLRVDIGSDGNHLIARLRALGTDTIIIANAHYLAPLARQVPIDLARRVGAKLVFSYEDGTGTTLHRTGLLDDAERLGWPCHPEHEPPFLIPDIPQPTVQHTPDDSDPGFPHVISTVGFGHFRAWNRQLLSPAEFDHLDRLYCDIYAATRTPEPTPETVSRLAQRHLAQRLRSQSITALRAMEAALFRDGVLWRLPLSTLDAWRESSQMHQPTDRDYARLVKLHDPEWAAIAVLVSLGYRPNTLNSVRLTREGTLTAPNEKPRPVPAAALLPLRVAAELNDGQLVTGNSRHVNAAIRSLTSTFGFPLPQSRGQVEQRSPDFAPERLDLRNYRTGTT